MDILVIRSAVMESESRYVELLASGGWQVSAIELAGALASPADIPVETERAIVVLDLAPVDMGVVCEVREAVGDVPLMVLLPPDAAPGLPEPGMSGASGHASRVIATLGAGADDVLARPFEPMELVERVRALRRRTRWQRQPLTADPIPHALAIDRLARSVRVDGEWVSLTGLEFDLLCYLYEHRAAPVTAAEITSQVHGTVHRDGGVVRQLVHKLRKKLGREASIVTQRGKGYALVLPLVHEPSK